LKNEEFSSTLNLKQLNKTPVVGKIFEFGSSHHSVEPCQQIKEEK
jgi:hypothetical protein